MAAAGGRADRGGHGGGVDHARRRAAGAGGTAPWANELSLMTPQILARLNAGRQGRIRGIRWIARVPARDPYHSGRHGSQRDRSGNTGIQGRLDPGPQGPRGGPQAARHVHRLHRRERPAPPGLRGGGQLDRRGAGRLLRPRSASRSTPTTRSPSPTTAAASRWTSTPPRRSPASSWRSPCCTPAASSTRAPTRCRAACTASASRWSTPSPSGSRSMVDRDGQRHHMAFVRGHTTKKLTVLGKAKGTGTTVTLQARPRDLPRSSSSTTPRWPTGSASSPS